MKYEAPTEYQLLEGEVKNLYSEIVELNASVKKTIKSQRELYKQNKNLLVMTKELQTTKERYKRLFVVSAVVNGVLIGMICTFIFLAR